MCDLHMWWTHMDINGCSRHPGLFATSPAPRQRCMSLAGPERPIPLSVRSKNPVHTENAPFPCALLLCNIPSTEHCDAQCSHCLDSPVRSNNDAVQCTAAWVAHGLISTCICEAHSGLKSSQLVNPSRTCTGEPWARRWWLQRTRAWLQLLPLHWHSD